MPNLGVWEILILLLVLLLVFGPKRLPGMGRSLGRGMREFKESVTDPGREIREAAVITPGEFKDALNPLAPTKKVDEPAEAPAGEASPEPAAASAEPEPTEPGKDESS
jgi:sec-independent protein translocase protein TatA